MSRLICLLVATVSVVLVKPAHAYLDPGTGSMLVQAVIAVIAAASVSLGIFRRQVASFFRKLFNRKHGNPDNENDANNC